ncbi:MAG: transposase, partial [Salinicola sp.]|uniref:IS66 family transposase n=1 Tax=Salinicola sp. TaxID=1978524 RepID=UPI001DE6E07F
CAKVSDSLQGAYDGLLRMLPEEDVLNVDETGHKDSGRRLWTWCFRAATFTLFKIDPSRASSVLVEVLGEEFDGVLGCDYFSAYRKYMKDADVLVQFCLAHLIRDVKFLVGHPEPRNRAYGRRVLEALRNLFAVIHRRESKSEAAFANQLQEAGNILYGTAIHRVPRPREAENLAYRFDMVVRGELQTYFENQG